MVVVGGGRHAIFVTAYDKHAVQAFEANALDYLLKPYSDERHDAAMARAKQRLSERSVHELGQRMLRMASQAPDRQRRLDRLVVKAGGTTRFIRVVDIDYIKAAGVYVSLHVAGKASALYRATLHELVERLDPMRFVRVHHWLVVNIESILQLEARSTASSNALLLQERIAVSCQQDVPGTSRESGWAIHCSPRYAPGEPVRPERVALERATDSARVRAG